MLCSNTACTVQSAHIQFYFACTLSCQGIRLFARRYLTVACNISSSSPNIQTSTLFMVTKLLLSPSMYSRFAHQCFDSFRLHVLSVFMVMDYILKGNTHFKWSASLLFFHWTFFPPLTSSMGTFWTWLYPVRRKEVLWWSLHLSEQL